jgi:hypothetical protein
MPEGDTLFRTASVLRDVLVGRPVIAARGRAGGPQLGRLTGSRIVRVDAVGKHLLIATDAGLTLHTHLGMHGSWHRYRTGEEWRRSPARAVAVIEVPGTTVVCFDAPTVELLDSRAVAIHPRLRELGPDLLAPEVDLDLAMTRLCDPARAGVAIGDALLDQRESRASATSTGARCASSRAWTPVRRSALCPTRRSGGSWRPAAGCSWRTATRPAGPRARMQSACRRAPVSPDRAATDCGCTGVPAGRAGVAERSSRAGRPGRSPGAPTGVPPVNARPGPRRNRGGSEADAIAFPAAGSRGAGIIGRHVFRYELGPVSVASTGIHSLDRSLFRHGARDAGGRRLVLYRRTDVLPA